MSGRQHPVSEFFILVVAGEQAEGLAAAFFVGADADLAGDAGAHFVVVGVDHDQTIAGSGQAHGAYAGLHEGVEGQAAQGGFGLTFNYARWALRANFNYRYDVDAINYARMNVENMASNNNQSIAVNHRWRKEGDRTDIPRALNNYGYNWLGSDRYVEDASFLRLSYLQLSYSVDPQKLKKYGMNALRFNGSMNNLAVWSKYTGLDPEVGYGSWGRAEDHAKTPRSRSYTLAVTVGF